MRYSISNAIPHNPKSEKHPYENLVNGEFRALLFSGLDTAKNVCYNDGESGKAHAAAPKEFAAKGRRLCVDISHSRRSKTLDCAMLRGHSPFAD